MGRLRFVLDTRDVTDLHTLMAWKSDQYQRTGRIDRFSQPWIVQLLEDLLETRNEHFSGLLSMLYAGDVPVAAHFGVRFGPTLSYWFPAYSTRFNVYSPGLLNTMRLIEGVAAQGTGLIDLGRGHNRYKEKLKSYDFTVSEEIVTRRSPLGAVHWARSTPTAWAIRQVRACTSPCSTRSTWYSRRARTSGAALRPGSPREQAGQVDSPWRQVAERSETGRRRSAGSVRAGGS